MFTDATSSLPIYSVRVFSVKRHHYPFIPFGSLVIKRHHYPLIPCAPCSNKSRFDLVCIPTVYFNCKYFTSLYFIYAQAIRMPPRDFAKSLRGQLTIKKHTFDSRSCSNLKVASFAAPDNKETGCVSFIGYWI